MMHFNPVNIVVTGILRLLFVTIVSTEQICAPYFEYLNSQSYESYPSGCTVIQGNVDLENSDLTETQISNKLSTVVTIEGYLWIAYTSLKSLTLFSNLRNVTGSKSAEAALFVSRNSRMKTMGLPNLVNVDVVDKWSFYIDQPNFCLSMVEITNLLNMKNAYFKQIPLCEEDASYCYGVKSTNIPEGCRIFNGDLNIETTDGDDAANVAKLTQLTTVVGNVRISSIELINLTLNIEHIYNDRADQYSSITVVSNDKLQSFNTPMLTKITNRNPVDVNIIGNPVLKLSAKACTAWNNLTTVSTKNNAKECVCTPEDEALNSQTYVAYPSGCTVIKNNIDLENTDLTEKELSKKLSSVVTIEGYLWITYTTLKSLSLFSNLRNVTGSLTAEASIFVFGNNNLKTVGLPNLTNVGLVNKWSFYIDNKPDLCLSMIEVKNLLSMKSAFFRQMPLCERDSTYCNGERSTNIPEGCRIFNGDINIETTEGNKITNIRRISQLTTVIGNIRISNTELTNLTMNVEHIYNDRSDKYSSISVIRNDKLESFSTPNLKKITNRNSTDIKVVGNSKLQLAPETCKTWNSLSSVSTRENAKECEQQSSTSFVNMFSAISLCIAVLVLKE